MSTTISSYQLVAADLPRALDTARSKPVVAREAEYYLAHIQEVKSIEDFLGDHRLFAFAMKAFGLEDMTYAKAFMRKVLAEGVDSNDAFARKLADTRYRDFAETFNFQRYGRDGTVFDRTRQGTVDRYVRQVMEEDAGSQNEGVRLALYFQRKAPTLTSAYGILADAALLRSRRRRLACRRPCPAWTSSGRQNSSPRASTSPISRIPASLANSSPVLPPAGTSATRQTIAVRPRFAVRATAGGRGRRRSACQLAKPASSEAPSSCNPIFTSSLSAQMSLQKRLETIAHNVANASTAGFRAEEIKFDSLLSQTAPDPVAFASAGTSFISRKSGEYVKTDNALDVAVEGDAWLGIQTPAGRVFTRDGRMRMTDAGELQTLNGHASRMRAAHRYGSIPTPGRRRSPATAPSLKTTGRLARIGLFAIDPKANLTRFENSGVIARPARGAGLGFQQGRHSARLHRARQRQSGHGDHQADHGAARVRSGDGFDQGCGKLRLRTPSGRWAPIASFYERRASAGSP